MSKELIEQLAKEHLKRGEVIADHEGYGAFTVTANGEFVRYDDVAKMIEAYQAAAPIDNVAGNFDYIISYLEECVAEGQVNLQGLINDVTNFRALIPTQANRTEG
jgi:hypothetical protein